MTPAARIRLRRHPELNLAISRDVRASTVHAINGLLCGAAWAGALVYGFPDARSDSAPAQGVVTPTTAMRDSVRDVFAAVAAFTNLDAREMRSADKDADISVVVAERLLLPDGALPLGGYAFLPGAGKAAGDVFIGRSYNDAIGPGGAGFRTLLHEIGHALGLKHPHEAGLLGALRADLDSVEMSVMSSRATPGAVPDEALGLEPDGWAETFMAYDIAALQHVYGADYSDRADDRYRFDPLQRVVSRTIWDGGGTDSYDFSRYVNGVTVSLAPGGHSTTGQEAQLNRAAIGAAPVYAEGAIHNAFLFHGRWGSAIENAVGGRGNDRIDGNRLGNSLSGGTGGDRLSGAAGSDTLHGGAGPDKLFGGSGDDALLGDAGPDLLVGSAGADRLDGGRNADRLTGGSGADVFAFARGGGTDTVTDFTPGPDRLDVGDPERALGSARATPDGVLIALGEGDSVLLAGLSLAAFSSTDLF